jgi:hypothetical protein
MLSDMKSEHGHGGGVHAVTLESLDFVKIERLYRFCQTIGGFYGKERVLVGAGNGAGIRVASAGV